MEGTEEGPDGVAGGDGAAYGIYDFVRKAVKSVWTKFPVSDAFETCQNTNLDRQRNDIAHLSPETLPAATKALAGDLLRVRCVSIKPECNQLVPLVLRRICCRERHFVSQKVRWRQNYASLHWF
jgi:hypothetical protein